MYLMQNKKLNRSKKRHLFISQKLDSIFEQVAVIIKIMEIKFINISCGYVKVNLKNNIFSKISQFDIVICPFVLIVDTNQQQFMGSFILVIDSRGGKMVSFQFILYINKREKKHIFQLSFHYKNHGNKFATCLI